MSEEPLLSLEEVSKSFFTPLGTVHALVEISAHLPARKIIGLLGPNGSGKTTLLRILTGILQPDRGTLLYQGKPISAEIQRKFGYMPEERGLYPKMTAYEQLLYFLRLRGLDRAEAQRQINYWAERLDMPWLRRPARTLSKGMQQKVQLTLALAGAPPLLLLDEPFSGLDPIAAHEVEVVLKEKVQEGTTILLSTHRLEQVDQLCDYVLLIHKGHLRLAGHTAHLRHLFWQHEYEVETLPPLSSFHLPPGIEAASTENGRFLLRVPATLSSRELLSVLMNQGEVHFFAKRLPTIREIFLQKVGEL